MVSILFSALCLAACGGGGGGADTTPTDGGSEQPQDTGQSTGPAPHAGPDALYFLPRADLAETGALDRLSGGTALFAAWNPSDPNTALKPGMKVMFFGAGRGCSAGTQGPLTALSDDRLAVLSNLTLMPAAAAKPALRWTPAGDADGCDAEARTRSGASAVYLNADDSNGAVGMLTTSGTQDDGAAPFFGPYGTAGQNGGGANAHITGTFVNFRQAWSAADPLQPWAGTAAARVRSAQSMGAFQLDAANGSTVQVKQQMMATFLNKACLQTMSGRPCQVQYLFNTAIARTGVTDWSTVKWFKDGGVWFDPAQGGIPIVDGPIYASGQSTLEEKSRLPLFVSQGSATQHKAFSGRTFDVTISFAQLHNALRITTARSLGLDLSAVGDSQMAQVWGASWNDRDAWVLLSGDVGQEVYNPSGTHKVQIGGGFRSLYVGPQ
ncbi:MAG: hypothetical protein IV094_09480 [Vitreoscilla sp.]|nr:hypothetical protein [Vitreoscilla sp.]